MNNPQYSVVLGDTGKRSPAQLQILAETSQEVPINVKLVRNGGRRVTE
jgi:hypothetical protein